jgi:hypothetical protein
MQPSPETTGCPQNTPLERKHQPRGRARPKLAAERGDRPWRDSDVARFQRPGWCSSLSAAGTRWCKATTDTASGLEDTHGEAHAAPAMQHVHAGEASSDDHYIEQTDLL